MFPSQCLPLSSQLFGPILTVCLSAVCVFTVGLGEWWWWKIEGRGVGGQELDGCAMAKICPPSRVS